LFHTENRGNTELLVEHGKPPGRLMDLAHEGKKKQGFGAKSRTRVARL